MFYTIYKITNQIDGKIYIGSHKTKNLNDGYMGSGKYLKYAQEKYGIENFTKEILYVYGDPESMFAKEAELVSEDFLATENTYNLKVGGFGGWDHVNMQLDSSTRRVRGKRGGDAWAHRLASDPTQMAIHSEKTRNMFLKLHSENRLKSSGFKNKKHTEDARKKIGAKNKINMSGVNHHSYGKFWITDGIQNKTIGTNETIPAGFRKGKTQTKRR